MSSRAIGAIGGLAPAAVILGWYLGTGGPPMIGLLPIVVAAVAAGWIGGPRVRGSRAADTVATANYFVVAYLLHAAADAVLVVSEEAREGSASDPSSVAQRVAVLWLVRLAYLPVWALFLSPAALAWIVAVRALRSVKRRRSGSADGPGDATSLAADDVG